MKTLPVNPDLPADFYNTPNDERSTPELEQWWDVPYAVQRPDGKYDVRCLDGGAWDRPTFYGIVDTIEEATVLAAQKLQEWIKTRSRPVVSLDNGKVSVVVMPASPLEDIRVLGTFDSMEAANAFITKPSAS